MQTIDVQPPSLAFAAYPLRDAAASLRLVVDHRRDVLAGIASPVVAAALRRFLAAWELVGLGAAEDATGLALFLDQAALRYGAVESAVVRPGHVTG